MERFNGKVVIVTGAASGIGEATARRFSSEGANVALIDRNKGALAKIVQDLPRSGRWLTPPTCRVQIWSTRW
jgi:meso-butanediol dehydrogenase/(S,S)-butanediol dehydrogenase/diacetyl reductase